MRESIHKSVQTQATLIVINISVIVVGVKTVPFSCFCMNINQRVV